MATNNTAMFGALMQAGKQGCPGRLTKSLQGYLRQGAQAHYQEPGDSGGRGTGSCGAGDVGQEVGPKLFFLEV